MRCTFGIWTALTTLPKLRNFLKYNLKNKEKRQYCTLGCSFVPGLKISQTARWKTDWPWVAFEFQGLQALYLDLEKFFKHFANIQMENWTWIAFEFQGLQGLQLCTWT